MTHNGSALRCTGIWKTSDGTIVDL